MIATCPNPDGADLMRSGYNSNNYGMSLSRIGALLFIQSPSELLHVAKVSGLVTDNVGGWLPHVAITFKAKNFEKKVVAGEDGRYEVQLPEGTYEVRGRLEGCKDFRLKRWEAKPDTKNTLDLIIFCPATRINIISD
jgi:hypothetical protein